MKVLMQDQLISTAIDDADICPQNTLTSCFQYPMDKNKGVKIPVQLRLNMWLGLSAHEKKFNSFAEGTFSVYAEMVTHTFWFVTRVIMHRM